MFNQLSQTVETLRNGFFHRKVLVIGDLMLDRYIQGEVKRISPEAPVPVVKVQQQTATLGGAANVALNLVRLGAEVAVAGVVGEDEAGDTLCMLLQQAAIHTRTVVRLDHRPTTIKIRIMSGQQQMLRLDMEDPSAIDDTLIARLVALINEELSQAYVVILSDYAKGVLQPSLCQAIILSARRRGIPVFVDPKGNDYLKYKGAAALSPNLAELSAITAIAPTNIEALLTAGEKLAHILQLDFLLVTRGEQGITLLQGGQRVYLPTMAREVFDVSGAGDTVIATLAAGVAAGLELVDALRLSNLAAGIVVGKLGTAPVDQNELLIALEAEFASQMVSKICDLPIAVRQITQWRSRTECIVFTNGCFDLLHAGHISYLQQARNLGDRLVVGLNTDDSVRRLKGPQRPIHQQEDRAQVLAALTAVDMVVLFDEDTPLQLILALHPDVLVKGADYAEHEVVGTVEVKEWGGRVTLISLLPRRSTTATIKLIEAANIH